MKKEKCSYCHKELGNKYTFTYGMPGVTQLLGCDRNICKFMRKFRRERNKYLKPFVKRLYEIVSK